MAKAKKATAAEYLASPYSRVLVPQDGGGFFAQILEFPGCYAEGDSAAEAYANLEEVAALWIESCQRGGTPIPPPVTNYEASGKFALRLPKSLYSRVSSIAALEGVSVNAYIVAAVAERLGSGETIDAVRKALLAISRQSALPSFNVTQSAETGAKIGLYGNH